MPEVEIWVACERFFYSIFISTDFVLLLFSDRYCSGHWRAVSAAVTAG